MGVYYYRAEALCGEPVHCQQAWRVSGVHAGGATQGGDRERYRGLTRTAGTLSTGTVEPRQVRVIDYYNTLKMHRRILMTL